MFYTYMHYTKDDNRLFYIGKGKGRRAWAKVGRNTHWVNTVKKHGYTVELCAEWPTEAEALAHEYFLIQCFRDLGHKLVNVTAGGDGVSGAKHTDESRKRISDSLKKNTWSQQRRDDHKKRMQARKGVSFSDEHRALLSKRAMGRVATEETRAKISAFHKGRTHTDAAKANMRTAQSNRSKRRHTEETKERLKAINKGKQLTAEQREKQLAGIRSQESRDKLSKANKGKTLSADHRAKISEALRSRAVKVSRVEGVDL
jgi:hypothetical protein